MSARDCSALVDAHEDNLPGHIPWSFSVGIFQSVSLPLPCVASSFDCAQALCSVYPDGRQTLTRTMVKNTGLQAIYEIHLNGGRHTILPQTLALNYFCARRADLDPSLVQGDGSPAVHDIPRTKLLFSRSAWIPGALSQDSQTASSLLVGPLRVSLCRTFSAYATKSRNDSQLPIPDCG